LKRLIVSLITKRIPTILFLVADLPTICPRFAVHDLGDLRQAPRCGHDDLGKGLPIDTQKFKLGFFSFNATQIQLRQRRVTSSDFHPILSQFSANSQPNSTEK